MSDYEITIRARNARILRLIRAQGFVTIRQFCAAKSLGYAQTLNLINSREPAIANDTWTPHARRLAAALNADVASLFTARQALGGIKSVTRETTEENLIALTEAQTETALIEESQDDRIARIERSAALDAAMNTLTPREREIIKRRFGLDGEAETLEQIGDHFGRSGAAIRQVEFKAIRKLHDILEHYDTPLWEMRKRLGLIGG